jgi:hypothetical protein
MPFVDDGLRQLAAARLAVLFTVTMPGTTERKYGLAAAGNSSWSWSAAVVVSGVRKVGELHSAAAALPLIEPCVHAWRISD